MAEQLTRRSQVGKKIRLKDPYRKAKPSFALVEDEIEVRQSNYPRKILVLQKVRMPDGAEELRLAYWTQGFMPSVSDKMVFGQYATFIPRVDFVKLVHLAKERWNLEI
jgi:hypothetical protein